MLQDEMLDFKGQMFLKKMNNGTNEYNSCQFAQPMNDDEFTNLFSEFKQKQNADNNIQIDDILYFDDADK